MRSIMAGVVCSLAVLAVVSAGLAQDKPPVSDGDKIVKELVGKLGDKDPKSCKDAMDKLVETGATALPALEEAAKSADAGVAFRAGIAIDIIGLRAATPEKLRGELPAIDAVLRDETAGESALTDLLDETEDKGLPQAALAHIVRGVFRRGGALSSDIKREIADFVDFNEVRDAADCVCVLMKDADPEVRASAADAMCFLRAVPKYWKDVAALMKDEVVEVRAKGVHALGFMEARLYSGEIAGLLADKSAAVRASAAFALGFLDADRFADGIAELLNDGEASVRAEAAYALGLLRSRKHIAAVMPLVKDSDAGVRANAAYAIGNMRAREFAKDIAGLLADEDVRIRATAAQALGQLGPHDYVKNLVPLFKDKEASVRLQAVAAVGQLGGVDILPDILALLADPDQFVRASALAALAYIGSPESPERVRPFLDDSSAVTRWTAAVALGELGAKDSVKDIAALLKDAEPSVRSFAARTLGELGAKEYAGEVAALMKGEDSEYAATAAISLAAMKSGDSAGAIAALLKDGNEWVRYTAAGALADAFARGVAAEAIGRIGAKEHAPALVKMLDDADDWAKINAAQALIRLGEPVEKPVAALLTVLARQDGDDLDRQICVAALNRLRSAELAAKLDSQTVKDVVFHGKMGDAIETICKQAGLDVRRPDVGKFPELDADMGRWTAIVCIPETPVSALLRRSMMEKMQGLHVALVLEGGEKPAMAVIDLDEAANLFREWWEKRGK
jgi:HEAT repeat protein